MHALEIVACGIGAFDVDLFVFLYPFHELALCMNIFYGCFCVLAQRVEEVFKRHHLRILSSDNFDSRCENSLLILGDGSFTFYLF